MIDPIIVKEFEDITGAKINLSYYEQNYELFSKLDLTRGENYDLIMATDFAVGFLRDKNLLKEIDKTKLEFWPDLAQEILGRTFDPKNNFSVPYVWDIYVVGYNKKYVDQQKLNTSLDIIFNPEYMPRHIAMLDEAVEAFSFASVYKFGGHFDYENRASWNAIKDVLLTQKLCVEAYTDTRAGDLLVSGSARVALAQASHIYKAKKISADIELFIPQPRTFMVVDSFVVSKSTKKEELLYKFLNFIYAKAFLRQIIDKYLYLPVRSVLLHEVDLSYLGGIDNLMKNASSAQSFVASKHFKDISRLWMEVKSY